MRKIDKRRLNRSLSIRIKDDRHSDSAKQRPVAQSFKEIKKENINIPVKKKIVERVKQSRGSVVKRVDFPFESSLAESASNGQKRLSVAQGTVTNYRSFRTKVIDKTVTHG